MTLFRAPTLILRTSKWALYLHLLKSVFHIKYEGFLEVHVHVSLPAEVFSSSALVLHFETKTKKEKKTKQKKKHHLQTVKLSKGERIRLVSWSSRASVVLQLLWFLRRGRKTSFFIIRASVPRFIPLKSGMPSRGKTDWTCTVNFFV